MLTMLNSLFTALEEGLAYFSIASNHSDQPSQMVRLIQSAMASKYETRNFEAGTDLINDSEQLEMVAA